MSLKEFWINNKWGFLYSSLTVFFVGMFLFAIKKVNVGENILALFATTPLIFIMSYGIYEFIGGDK